MLNSQKQEATRTLTAYKDTLPTPEEKREQLRKSLNISSWDNTFENYDPVPGTEKCLAAFKALASDKTKWKMILCYGGVGNGKTMLAEATVLELHKRGIFCRIMIYYRMMDALKSTMNTESKFTMDQLMSNFRNSERLIIDDVGAGVSDTAFSFQKLEEIILHRYRENMFTILVTNLDIKQLPERVWDRFKDKSKARMVLNTAPSYRGNK